MRRVDSLSHAGGDVGHPHGRHVLWGTDRGQVRGRDSVTVSGRHCAGEKLSRKSGRCGSGFDSGRLGLHLAAVEEGDDVLWGGGGGGGDGGRLEQGAVLTEELL